MRVKSLIGTLTAIFTFAWIVFSCSADYDYSSSSLSSITLKANIDQTTIGIDQELVFAVINTNTEEDLTASATIYIDGDMILPGNSYSFTTEGVYSFHATLDGLTSNVLTFTVVSDKYVTVSVTKALRGQQVTFGFFDVAGEDLTDEATFYVNGEAISGNTFSSGQEGDYEVYAQYQGINFDGVSFSVFIPRKKVVFEDYTGAWCGWCPRVVTAIHKLQEVSEHIVAIAVHNNDVMAIPQESQLRQEFGVVAFPAARMDRTTAVPSPEDSQAALDFVLEQAGIETNLSIAIQTELNGNMLSVTTKVISEDALPQSYKLVVYLYQDGLIFPQVNYYTNIAESPWYGLGNPIPNFVHNEVLEASLTNIFGDLIQATAAYEEYTVNYNPVDLSQYGHSDANNSYNPNNFGVAVYLVDQDNKALNAQHVKAGQSAGFE